MTCRICMVDDDDDDLGELVSPCKCKGTMRLVHIGCLSRWRAHSQNPRSAVMCDSCRYPYQFTRSRRSLIIRSALALQCVSFAAVVISVYVLTIALQAVTEQLDYQLPLASDEDMWPMDGWVDPQLMWGSTLVALFGFLCSGTECVFGFATPIHLQLMFGGGLGHGISSRVLLMCVLMGVVNALTAVYHTAKVQTAKILEGKEDILQQVSPLTTDERLRLRELSAQRAEEERVDKEIAEARAAETIAFAAEAAEAEAAVRVSGGMGSVLEEHEEACIAEELSQGGEEGEESDSLSVGSVTSAVVGSDTDSDEVDMD
eukprot:TRINITY_DN7365_c0_g3_i2.p2 TRINITY_DN7365_c0_g3~~TRINITY_DN7365_c0_g3_i2.p2  ORF type:complete len:316 (-),score=71.12 TRINITY_DN7365_c0_g3_i2:200-1147(-)